MNHGAEDGASLLRQPRAVWAVAFACVAPYVAGKLADHVGPAERPIEDRLAEAEAELAVVAG